MLYIMHTNNPKKTGDPELLKHLQIELSGFAEYLVAAVIPNV